MLENVIRQNQDAILDALEKDFRKPHHETWLSEIGVVLDEIRLAKKKLRCWMKPKRARTSLLLFPARARIYYEPRGVVLIIGPWNYPFQLIIEPLVGAIAAGCCATLKPSEISTHTSRLILRLISQAFPTDYISVVEGGVQETTNLLNQKWDHIFFTGSTTVGRAVMLAAARHLTPVTLELGGKSPVIVDATANIDLAARRIVWGKIFNCGQTCVAPDYVCAEESIAPALMAKMKEEILRQLGPQPQKSTSYSRVINSRHHQRIVSLIDQKNIFYGGGVDEADLYIQPTILKEVRWTDPIMNQEIFGPLIPILTFSRLSQCLSEIRKHPKALAAYLFTESPDSVKAFLGLSFGGGCINDVLAHFGNSHFPFGGVGDSGLGQYHGRSSFETFSHAKSILHRYRWLDLSVRYPPYTLKKTAFLKRLFRS